MAANYTDLLTENEIDRIVAALPEGSNAKDVLDLMAFYVECKMVADGVLSGDFEVTGADNGGLKYRLSEKARRRLH